jgi:DNA-binding transcriptional ArsR family regulator
MIRQKSKLVQLKSEFFKAFTSPLRIEILEQLLKDELSVTELTTRLNAVPTHVSQQLAVLKGRNIVVAKRRGSSVYYSCPEPAIAELLKVA